MCGIVGYFDYQSTRSLEETILANMTHAIEHRGPDDAGLFQAPGVGLGHRRLAIIDLNQGKQPIYNHDHSIVIVFNGEIYNYKTLRQELSQKGYPFKTHTDTEAILAAYCIWGTACLDRLQGMFAFAIWDSNQRQLFLARDRIGIKPLYYSLLPGNRLIFASELKALMCHPEFNVTLDSQAVDQYFAFGYVPDPKTIFTNTHKLSPGHFIAMQHGTNTIAPQCYWDVSFHAHQRDESTLKQRCIATLDEAVRSHLVADVPVGAFLSGGVDSSAVVASMSSMIPSVQTCSVAFSEKSHNESEYALEVAKQYQTAHKDYQLGPIDISLIDKLSDIYDEPFADSSAIPTFRVCQLARKQVKVVLSGDGGDETLAGYRRYRFHLHEEKVKNAFPLALRKPIFGVLGKCYPKLDWAPRFLRAKATFQSLGQNSLEGYFNSIAIFKDIYRHQLFASDFKQELQQTHPINVFERYAEQFYGDSALSFVQYLDMKTYLPGDILTKVDRASMAHGLEVRVPLLDHQWIEWAATVPDDYKIHQGEGKYILKQALRQRLSDDILFRKKQGFAVPLQKWFQGALRERILDLSNSQGLQQSNLFNKKLIDTLVKQHLAGSHDHSAMIWSLLVFDNFYQQKILSARTQHAKENTAFA